MPALNVTAGDRRTMPPDDFAEDVLVEMANLDEQDTHIQGTISISAALGQHGPRVNWYPGTPGRTAPCVIVSIGPDPEVGATSCRARSADLRSRSFRPGST